MTRSGNTMMHRSFHSTILLPAAFALMLANGATTLANEMETAVAQYQSVESERLLDGVIEAINRATVSSQVSARVVEINFDVDDHVEQGTLIVAFDDTEYQARLREARASRNAAGAALEAALAHFQRIENLFQRQTASQSDFDRARAELGSARAQVEAAKAVVARVEQQLEYTRVRAPYTGIVTERHIEIGETANPGSPLMSGFSLDHLRAVVNFPQRLVPTISPDTMARVLIPGSAGESIEAEAITIFPYADRGSSTIVVRVELPRNTEGMFPGMLVKVAFSTGKRLRLAIPGEALVHRSEVVGVYILGESGDLSFRHIRTGNSTADGTVEVLAGLDDGERVVLDPAIAAAQLRQQKAAVSQ